MLKRIFGILLITYWTAILLMGCGNNHSENDYKNYKQIYMDITETLDIKDPYGSLEKINNERFIQKFNELKNVVSKIQEETNSDMAKRIFEGNVQKSFTGLDFLLYAAQNKDTLSQDERGRIATELTFVEMFKNDIKNGEI